MTRAKGSSPPGGGSARRGPRGAPDVLPPDSELLSEVESVARNLFDRAGYRRIETPAFEHTEVFQRTIGESSDIVRKEMYTFTDRRDRSLTLRPEGTAPVARAYVEHRPDGTLPLPIRLWYIGPFFRYERPQKGRNRQFVQAGAECIGSASPVMDAEIIAIAARFFDGVGLEPELLLNSMGCLQDRERYTPVLRAALEPHLEDLCDDCHQRLQTNPLRVFDCKVESCRRIVRAEAPPVTDHLCEECKQHFAEVQEILEVLGIAWRNAPDLVRGLDYYTRTVFEFEVATLGGRPTVGSGGRYDGLVQELGGPPTPGVGLAIGIEPTLQALRDAGREPPPWRPDVFVAWLEGLAGVAMATATDLRAAGLRAILADEGSLKSQLRTADRLGALRAVILGPDEVARGVATVRDLDSGEQTEVSLSGLVERLA